MAASEAPKAADGGPLTIFHRIVAGEIPCSKVYEDEFAFAFNDISPTAPRHILIVPKNRDGLVGLSSAEERHVEALGRLMLAATKIAAETGLDKTGFRIVINDGTHGCQSVPYLHLHLIGGKQLSWPPGTGLPEGAKEGTL